MAYTTINKSTDYFNTVLYTGNGSTQSITGVGFQTDFNWIKNRANTNNHSLIDVVRGIPQTLRCDVTSPETTDTGTITSFDSDGFSMSGTNGKVNTNGDTYASWNWKANGAGSSNTDGSISSTVSVSATSGFSIVSYTGTGSAGTVGHGLGSTPKMIIIKNITQVTDWVVGHQEADTSNPWNKYLQLNDPTVPLDSPVFNDTAPTNSVFSVGADGKTSSGAGSHIAYCFADVQGYSKFGSYTGNGNADGTFVYTGFKSSFILLKKSSGAGTDWYIFNNKSPGYNDNNKSLRANTSATEASASGYSMDILSNGFKIRTSNTALGESGATYIYMAFAEAPLVGTNGVTAKAR